MLRALSAYCMNTVSQNVPYGEQASALLSSGFTLKRQKAPQGRLEMVRDFRRFIAANLRWREVKLRWKRPLNVRTHTNVSSYLVFRNSVPEFATAIQIDCVTATTITDAPGVGNWFYWVVPFNCMGNGVTSQAVRVTVV